MLFSPWPGSLLLLSLAALGAVGVWASDVSEAVFERGDDGRIVVDEIVGQLLALAPLAVAPASARAGLPEIAWLVTAFVLFRVFDIAKPGPVGWAERRFSGGLGVMMDDVVAGLLAAAVLLVLMGLRALRARGRRVKAEVLTIGDELLRGEIVDSNKSFLSERLLRIDVDTRFHASVRDDPADMRDAFLRAAGRVDVVLVSGGLGPTRDDITLEVLAETFGRKLVLHEPSLKALEAFFARFGRKMAANNAKQAWFPEGSDVLPNPVGSAPGCLLEAEDTLFFCMPGVPRELFLMMDEQVVPRIAARTGGQGGAAVRATLLRTFGIGESNLDEELADLARGEHVSLGFRTTFPDNFLRPVARGATVEEAEARLDDLCGQIRERLGALVYGEGDEQSLEAVVVGLLRARGLTVATAESCTGGMIGAKLTAVPGSSDCYLGGVVAYANEAKTRDLGVPEALLAEHGAVSEPVARAMARGVRERFGCDLAVSTTGISGPGGGTDEKPVGLVWVGFASAEGDEALDFVFPFDRERHRQVTAQVALDWIRRDLLGEERVAVRYLQTRPGGR